MARRRMILVRVAGLLVLVVLGLVVWVYAASASILGTTYPMPDLGLRAPTDAAAVERGKHLVLAVGACPECHDPDLGGKVYADMGPVGIVAGRNLTRGRGGIGAAFSDADWVRA